MCHISSCMSLIFPSVPTCPISPQVSHLSLHVQMSIFLACANAQFLFQQWNLVILIKILLNYISQPYFKFLKSANFEFIYFFSIPVFLLLISMESDSLWILQLMLSLWLKCKICHGSVAVWNESLQFRMNLLLTNLSTWGLHYFFLYFCIQQSIICSTGLILLLFLLIYQRTKRCASLCCWLSPISPLRFVFSVRILMW